MSRAFSLAIILLLFMSAGSPVYSQKIKNKSARQLKSVPKKNVSEPNVKLGSFEAFSDGRGVYLRWQTEFESKNLGFFVYRITARGVEQVSQSLIPGAALQSSEPFVYGREYSSFDAAGDGYGAYYIESLATDGERRNFPPVYPQYVKDLQAFAGASDDLFRAEPGADSSFVEASQTDYPAELQKQFSEHLLPPDIDMQRWVAGQPGVKIGIRQEGIYRVSRTELQAAGFDVSVPSSQWQLYADGIEQAITIGPGDAYIEFYGQGMDTPESATRVYFLITGTQNGKRIGTGIIRRLSGNVVANSFGQQFLRKERAIYISTILNGEVENFFGSAPIIGNATNPVTYNFDLPAVDFSAPTSRVEISVQALTTGFHLIRATLNGQPLPDMTNFGIVLVKGEFEIPTSMLQEGTNTLQFRAHNGGSDISVLESIRIGYARKYEASQNRLSFYTANYKTTTVSGFSSPNIRVFDLTDQNQPRLITNLRIDNNNGNYSVYLPSHRGRVMYALEETAVQAASFVVANSPSLLANPNHHATMIVVTHKDWRAEADDWANYRRGQGMSVEVVDVEDIFDEFGYGSLSTAALNSFFQYAKNNWLTPPSYVLLIGDASYDYRNYGNRPFQSFVPTKLVDTLFEETGSDEALCDFNNDGLAEIAVGRIPARSGAIVTQLLNKTMTFESTVGQAPGRGALCVSDSAVDYDFEAVCGRLSALLPTSIPKSQINRGQPDARNLLLASLNNGRYLVNYVGHGSVGLWASSSFFSSPDGAALTNAPNYSIFMMLTCLNGYFLNPSDGLAESLLKASDGGAAATWASTGRTTPDVQEVMATRFYNQIAAGNLTRLGDLVRDAKQVLTHGRDVRLSWALLGDPALKVR